MTMTSTGRIVKRPEKFKSATINLVNSKQVKARKSTATASTTVANAENPLTSDNSDV